MDRLVVIIEGLGNPGTSPVGAMRAPIKQALPDAIVVVAHWKLLHLAGPGMLPVGAWMDFVIIGHSLGGYAAIWLAGELEKQGVRVRLLVLEDPVTGDEAHPLAQIGASPLDLPGNVDGAVCYLRGGVMANPLTWPCVPPFHQGLAKHDDRNFLNIQVPDSDHNSIIEKTSDEVVSRICIALRKEAA